jgi:glycosyltransferase involved in cell wall biosynthesis
MEKPTISVAMVVCNASRFLSEAVESILNQTFGDFEFVVVDFGSTDDSRAIISQYAARDSRLKLHVIPQCGLAEARNVSCSLARGEYIAIMDADDVAVSDRLSMQFEFMSEHRDVAVLGGAVEWIDSNGRSVVVYKNPHTHRDIESALLERCPVWQPTVLMRREAFLTIGGYRPPFAPAEDYDLWLRMAERFRLANLEQVVLKYRIHPYQVSIRRRTDQALGILAARFAGSCRRDGLSDPFNKVDKLTSELLVTIGIPQEAQRSVFAQEQLRWIRNLRQAREYATALNEASDLLQSSDSGVLDQRQLADLCLTVAGLYWRQQNILKCISAAARAIAIRPRVVGRPLRPLLRRLRLA